MSVLLHSDGVSTNDGTVSFSTSEEGAVQIGIDICDTSGCSERTITIAHADWEVIVFHLRHLHRDQARR